MIKTKKVVGVSIGTVMYHSFCHPFAPSMLAASYKELEMPCKAAKYTIM